MKNNDLKIFLKNWLIHLLLFLVIMNLYDSIDYLVRLQINGPFHINADGSSVTLWQRFILHNFQRPDNLFVIAFTILVEVNHHFIYNKFRWFTFLAVSILVSVIITLMFSSIHSLDSRFNLFRPGVLVLAYLIGYSLLRSFVKHRLYHLQVRLNHSENELHVLKQQLNPHFLFNALNYLYGTALQERANLTAEGIDIMAGMMRHSLIGMQETYVSLLSEIAFIKQYVYFQQLRLPVNDKTVVNIKITESDQPYIIAPMLLIPLIENAFKHSVHNESSTFIDIELTVSNGNLNLNVRNSIGSDPNKIPSTKSGLTLIKKRLELLYPKKYSFRVIPGNKLFQVVLNVKLS